MTPTEFELIHEDCFRGMLKLPTESVDLIVTSPPYNLGIRYGKYEDNKSWDDYFNWCQEWAEEARRILKPDGSFFLNVGSCPSNPLAPHEMIVRLKSLFVLQNTFHWIKSITIETRDGQQISAGHFKPINSERFVNDCHEYIFHLTKTGAVPIQRRAIGVPYQDKSNIARWAHTSGSDKRCRGNNWFIPYKTIVSRDNDRPHPATFPAQLAEYCIRLHGNIADLTVLDPFLGLGHSAIAAKTCGVKKFIGFDIDEEYLKIARRNVAEFELSLEEPVRAAPQTSPEQSSLFQPLT